MYQIQKRLLCGSRILKTDHCVPSIWDYIFSGNKTYLNLSHELFNYILNDNYIQSQFRLPDPHNLLIFQLIHVYLMKQRISHNSKQNGQIFEYYCQTYYYPKIGQYRWNYLNEQDFEGWMVQQISTEFNVLQSQIIALENVIFQRIGIQKIIQESEVLIKQSEIIQMYNQLFRKVVFMNQVTNDDLMVNKVTQYYMAHRNYLKEIQDIDLYKYKINWGLKQQLSIE